MSERNKRTYGFKVIRPETFRDRNLFASHTPNRILKTDGSWNTCHAPKKALSLCVNGIHVWNNLDEAVGCAHDFATSKWVNCTPTWYGLELWLVELKGKTVSDEIKTCARHARFLMRFNLKNMWRCFNVERIYPQLVDQFNRKYGGKS